MKYPKKQNLFISTEKLTLKALTLEDVSQKYVDWLNDTNVNQYLETRFSKQTLESCRQYVSETNNNPAHYLFGIFTKDTNEHIGNIKLGFINFHHKYAQLALFIGEKSHWNKGIATEVICAITDWAFNELDLRRVEAGCYDTNLGSLRAFLKAGYSVEGYKRQSVISNDQILGSFWMSKLSSDITG